VHTYAEGQGVLSQEAYISDNQCYLFELLNYYPSGSYNVDELIYDLWNSNEKNFLAVLLIVSATLRSP